MKSPYWRKSIGEGRYASTFAMRLTAMMLAAAWLAACANVTATSSPAPAIGRPTDCQAAALYAEREACYAGVDAAACAADQTCTAFRAMHGVEQRLETAERELVQRARAAYASYGDGDPRYLDDLQTDFAAGAASWRRYRDAHCESVPLLQGMSRRDAGGITEACRLEVSQGRLKDLETLLQAF